MKRPARGKAAVPPLVGVLVSEAFAKRAIAMAQVPEDIFEAYFDARHPPDRELDPKLLESAAKAIVTARGGGDIAPVSTRNAGLLWCTAGRHEIPDGTPVVFEGRSVSLSTEATGLRFDKHWCLAHLCGSKFSDEPPKAEHFLACAQCARPCVTFIQRRYEPRAPWVRNHRPRRPQAWGRWRIFCSTLCEWRFHGRRRKQRRAERRAGKTCPECETVFDPPRSDAIFCSVACRMRAHRRRAAEEAPLRSGRAEPIAARVAG